MTADPAARRPERVLFAGEATRRAALMRIALSALVGPITLLLAIMLAGAGNPLGLLAALPAIYLIFIFVLDLVAVVRGFWAQEVFRGRPLYALWLGVCIVLSGAWFAFVAPHLSWHS